MPTYDQEERFRHEYYRLRRTEQRLFNQAGKEFVTALKEHRPPPKKLGIERFERLSGVYQGPRKTPCLSTGDTSGLAALTRTHVLWYISSTGNSPGHTRPRWTITVSPALLDAFPPLAAAHRRSRSSALV